jgi:PKD repeat protein
MRKKIFGMILFLIGSIILFSSYWTDWIEYPANPVLDPANGALHAYYPSVLYDQNAFSGHGTNAYYKMWFDHDEGAGVGFAYSDDGINWTEYNNSAALPGLQAIADHPVVLYDSGGFGGTPFYYKIWYWHFPAGYDSIAAIRYAESTDGITWVNDQPIQQHPTDTNLQLIFGVWGTYFYHNYGPGSVLYNSAATNTGSSTPNDKTDDQPMTYSYVMYYLAAGEGGTPNGSSEQEAMAYSTDGIYWIRYGDEPVLMTSGNVTDWDGKYTYGSTVVRTGSTYHMWYIGADGDPAKGTFYAHGIGHASSSDGLNWTRDPDNPVFHCTDGVAWRNVNTHAPSVIYDPSNFSGHGDPYPLKMWFAGSNGTNDTIGYAWLPPASGGNPPNACFYYSPKKGYAPLNVNFNGGCSSDSDGFITNYSWDFGDENTGTGILTSHNYTEIGKFEVELTVTDNDGLTDSSKAKVKVISPVCACCKCTSETSSDLTGFAPFTMEMYGGCSKHYNGKEIVQYEWDMGNSNKVQGVTSVYTYNTEGKYNVRLTVTDSDGYSNTACCAEVTVYKVYPPTGISRSSSSHFELDLRS